MKEINNYFTGDLSTNYLIAAFFFVLVGFIIVKIMMFKTRKKSLIESKKEFDLVFWLKDNLPDLLLNLLVTISFIRFTSDIVTKINVDWLHFGTDPMFIFLLFGVAQQGLIELLWVAYKKFFSSK